MSDRSSSRPATGRAALQAPNAAPNGADDRWRASARSFLAEATNDLAQLSTLDDVTRAVGPKVCRFLGVTRCTLVEVDEMADPGLQASDWHMSGVPDIAIGGRLRILDFLTRAQYRAPWSDEMIVVRDTSREPHAGRARCSALDIRSYLTARFGKNGHWRFLVNVSHNSARHWKQAEIDLVQEWSARIWLRLQAARAESALQAEVRERCAAQDQIKALFARLITIQEDERRRIARNVHDELGQHMTALRMNLEGLRARAESDSALAEQYARLRQLAKELDRGIDLLTLDLRPAALDHLGLSAALDHLVNGWSHRFGVDAEFDASWPDSLRLSPEVEAHLYRLAQEALHNVCKHAHATRVSVLLERRECEAVLVVEDNGCGFDPGMVKPGQEGHLGLASMRERATLAGGTIEIESPPGKGTTIFVHVPVGGGSSREPAREAALPTRTSGTRRGRASGGRSTRGRTARRSG